MTIPPLLKQCRKAMHPSSPYPQTWEALQKRFPTFLFESDSNPPCADEDDYEKQLVLIAMARQYDRDFQAKRFSQSIPSQGDK